MLHNFLQNIRHISQIFLINCFFNIFHFQAWLELFQFLIKIQHTYFLLLPSLAIIIRTLFLKCKLFRTHISRFLYTILYGVFVSSFTTPSSELTSSEVSSSIGVSSSTGGTYSEANTNFPCE